MLFHYINLEQQAYSYSLSEQQTENQYQFAEDKGLKELRKGSFYLKTLQIR